MTAPAPTSRRDAASTGRRDFAPLLRALLRDRTCVLITHDAADVVSLADEAAAQALLDEAISTAGGVRFGAVDGGLMLRARPGVFVAGEMLDWDAPTGGYLLTACLATGRHAGLAAAQRLAG